MINNDVYLPKKILLNQKNVQEILQLYDLVQEDYQVHDVHVKFDLANILIIQIR